MAFFGAPLAKGLSCVAVANPLVGVVVGLTALTVFFVYKANQNDEPIKTIKTYEQMLEQGDVGSSDVEKHFNLGKVGTYSNIILARHFSKGKDGDKGYVEADHIPPLESLRRAEDQPEFCSLRYRNPDLYNMVLSLRNDPRGRNLMVVQVPTHDHRIALSTGASRASRECRLLLACIIAGEPAERMLRVSFIIAHPYASQQIREDAEMGNRKRKRKFQISKDRTMRIYRNAFTELVDYYYYVKGIINKEEHTNLKKFVKNDGYLDRESDEYQEIVDIVRRYGKPNN